MALNPYPRDPHLEWLRKRDMVRPLFGPPAEPLLEFVRRLAAILRDENTPNAEFVADEIDEIESKIRAFSYNQHDTPAQVRDRIETFDQRESEARHAS